MPASALTIRSRILIAGGAVFFSDRLSKLWVVEWMDLQSLGRIDVLPPYLNFAMAWNRGINFGIFNGDSQALRWFLILLSVAISAALVWWLYRRAARPDSMASVPALAWSAGILIGGALGNAWDRVQYGAVADFLNMSCCGIDNPFAFNIADVSIFAGAGLIALKA